MAAEPPTVSRLEVGHVLFLDIVGYSKLLSDKQRKVFQLLKDIVRDTSQFRSAEAANKLVRIPTGDGMVLAFFTSVDAPVRCALEISRKLRDVQELPAAEVARLLPPKRTENGEMAEEEEEYDLEGSEAFEAKLDREDLLAAEFVCRGCERSKFTDNLFRRKVITDFTGVVPK